MAEISEINLLQTDIVKTLHSVYSVELQEVNNIILSQLECDEELIEEIGAYLVKSGGKRIRPLLTILSSYLFNYQGTDHLKLAASTEFIHAATLLHDDVVDASMLRRFKPTANSIWGNQAAILVGDYLFSQAFRLMVATNSLDSLKALSDASATIAKGEVSQLAYVQSQKFPSRENYFTTIEAKTAELFASSCKVGSIIAKAVDKEIEALYNYGKYVGLIFQIQDDMLDYFSKSTKIGKNIGDDFYEGKVTLPVIIMHEKASEEDKNLISSYFFDKENRSKDSLDHIIDLLNKYDIEKEISTIVETYSASALKILKAITTDKDEIVGYMRDLIKFASKRES